jgi:hypothetical protein
VEEVYSLETITTADGQGDSADGTATAEYCCNVTEADARGESITLHGDCGVDVLSGEAEEGGQLVLEVSGLLRWEGVSGVWCQRIGRGGVIEVNIVDRRKWRILLTLATQLLMMHRNVQVR